MRKIIPVLLFFTLQFTQSQIRGITEKGSGLIHLEPHQISLNLINPGLRYEIGLFRNVTATASSGFGVLNCQEGYVFGYALHTSARYYYNLKRRIDLNKNVSGNSGNYISPIRSIFFSQLRAATNVDGPKDFNVGFYGLVYGIQRTYEKGFNFNFEAGPGYIQGDGVPSGYGILFNFSAGWVSTKRKSKTPVFD